MPQISSHKPVSSHHLLFVFHNHMPSFDNHLPAPAIKALHRRLSAHTSRTSSILKLNRTHPLSQGRAINVVQPTARLSPHLPPEILDRIILLAIGPTHSFRSIASFSLASSDFRQIALRRFFWSLRIKSSAHLFLLSGFLDEMNNLSSLHLVERGYLWVR